MRLVPGVKLRQAVPERAADQLPELLLPKGLVKGLGRRQRLGLPALAQALRRHAAQRAPARGRTEHQLDGSLVHRPRNGLLKLQIRHENTSFVNLAGKRAAPFSQSLSRRGLPLHTKVSEQPCPETFFVECITCPCNPTL